MSVIEYFSPVNFIIGAIIAAIIISILKDD